MQSYFFLLLIGGGLKCMTQILMLPKDMWPRGLMDKASVFGTEDCRFESYRGHFYNLFSAGAQSIQADCFPPEKLLPTVGLEPTTTRLRALRSTN